MSVKNSWICCQYTSFIWTELRSKKAWLHLCPLLPPPPHSCHRLINARWEEHSEMYLHNYFSSGVHCIFLFIPTFTLLTFNTNTVLFLFYVMTLLCSRKKYLSSRGLKILVYFRFFPAPESILVAASSKAVYCINYVSEQQRHQGCFEPLLYKAFKSPLCKVWKQSRSNFPSHLHNSLVVLRLGGSTKLEY